MQLAEFYTEARVQLITFLHCRPFTPTEIKPNAPRAPRTADTSDEDDADEEAAKKAQAEANALRVSGQPSTQSLEYHKVMAVDLNKYARPS